MTNKVIQHQLVKEMERNLQSHGDTYQGVGWTKSQENTDKRYQVMLELIPDNEPCTLLDIGCGAAHLYDYMLANKVTNVRYSGLDLSPEYLQLCQQKHPTITFFPDDILDASCHLPQNDYVLMNGVFNYKGEHSHDDMWRYCQKMLTQAQLLAKKGFACNFVSSYVDWERDDLFHLPFDQLAIFLDQNISRYFTIRHDYGLYEYTVYIYAQDE
jgi:SAM-dependent methyltransferase